MRLQDTVSGCMSDRPVTLPPDRPLIDAFVLMIEYDVRHVPVVDAGRLVGILSNRDVRRAFLAQSE